MGVVHRVRDRYAERDLAQKRLLVPREGLRPRLIALFQNEYDTLAWHVGNSGGRTHGVATKAPDGLGLHDLFGNAAEWVTTGENRRPAARGGSFRDAVASIGPQARAVQDDTWNERDPQIPQSRWWLSDAPFVGFRIVREP